MTQTKRHHDWMPRLQALVESRLHTRFEFGHHDCCMWACDVVQAVAGYDPARGLRGTYASETEAAAIINEAGGLEALAAGRFGEPISPTFAGAGDVGLIESDAGLALVACVGGHWLAAGAFGLTSGGTDAVLKSWRAERSPPTKLED